MDKSETIHFLFWYIAGAVTYAALRYLIFYREHKNIFVSIVTSYITLITMFGAQLKFAHEKRIEWLRESGMSEDEVTRETEGAQLVIDKWQSVSVTILAKSLPEKYLKYLQVK